METTANLKTDSKQQQQQKPPEKPGNDQKAHVLNQFYGTLNINLLLRFKAYCHLPAAFSMPQSAEDRNPGT